MHPCRVFPREKKFELNLNPWSKVISISLFRYMRMTPNRFEHLVTLIAPLIEKKKPQDFVNLFLLLKD